MYSSCIGIVFSRKRIRWNRTAFVHARVRTRPPFPLSTPTVWIAKCKLFPGELALLRVGIYGCKWIHIHRMIFEIENKQTQSNCVVTEYYSVNNKRRKFTTKLAWFVEICYFRDVSKVGQKFHDSVKHFTEYNLFVYLKKWLKRKQACGMQRSVFSESKYCFAVFNWLNHSEFSIAAIKIVGLLPTS